MNLPLLRQSLTLALGLIAGMSSACAEGEAISTSAQVEQSGPATQSPRAALSQPNLGPEQQIEERQRIFSSVREALEGRFKALNRTMANLSERVDNNKLVSQEAAQRLIGIYENMRPREAATVFNVMDLHVLIALAASMNTRKLSAIMAYMNADRVNMVSQYMVGLKHFRQDITIPALLKKEINSTDFKHALMPSRQ